MTSEKPETIDQYISGFPEQTQILLKKVRNLIKKLVPAVEEKISYGIPAFFLNKKYLVYFAGYKNHISIYPVPSGNKELDREFEGYNTSGKGTIQFPLDQPLPEALVIKIVQFLVKENERKQQEKKSKVK